MTNFIVIEKQANSLFSLIADGQHRQTTLGRDLWKSLISSEGSLQLTCNMEGFNTACGKHRARIGILSNNEKHLTVRWKVMLFFCYKNENVRYTKCLISTHTAKNNSNTLRMPKVFFCVCVRVCGCVSKNIFARQMLLKINM